MCSFRETVSGKCWLCSTGQQTNCIHAYTLKARLRVKIVPNSVQIYKCAPCIRFTQRAHIDRNLFVSLTRACDKNNIVKRLTRYSNTRFKQVILKTQENPKIRYTSEMVGTRLFSVHSMLCAASNIRKDLDTLRFTIIQYLNVSQYYLLFYNLYCLKVSTLIYKYSFELDTKIITRIENEILF